MKPTSEGQKSILTLRELRRQEKEACEESFAQFVQSAWGIWHPADDVVWGWPQQYMCDALQIDMERIAAREASPYKYTICNVPPGSSKSTIFSRMANPWAWTKWPWMRFISSSHESGLSLGMSEDSLNIIQSDWYQENWGRVFKLRKNKRSGEEFENNCGGGRYIASTGKSPVGKHCHIFGHDDPINPEATEYEKQLMIAVRYITKSADQRMLPFGVTWLVMQRLHENDPTGYLLEKRRKRVRWICIPAEITANIKPEPPELEAKYKDNLFFPEYFNFSRPELEAKRADNPSVYACQYLQRPSPEEGGMFKRNNWRFWVPAGTYLDPVKIEVGTEVFTCENVEFPMSFDCMVNSWDFTFKDKLKSDFVSGHVVAQKAANFFVMDEHHKKVDYHQSKLEVIAMKKKWPLTSTVYYEDKANGPAIASELCDLVEGMEPVGADGSEGPYTRAVVISSIQKTGNVILPHPKVCPWVNDLIEEFAAFPNGRHDDRVASICQAIHKMRKARPVIPGFRQTLQQIKIDWRNLGSDTQLYIFQHVGPHLDSSVILSLWSPRVGRLVVFDEFTVNETRPEIIKPSLEMKIRLTTDGIITNLSRFQWYGDSSMFARSRASSALRSLVQVDSISEVYFRCGINVLDNVMYHEGGAIVLLQRMVAGGHILIDQRAPETSRQVSAWQYEGDSSAPGNGCARALCNNVSVLYESAKSEPDKMKELKPYSEQKMAVSNEIEKYGSDADIDKRLRQVMSNRRVGSVSAREKVNPQDRWQV